MSLLLALETSSVVCSVALYKNEQLLGASEIQIEKSHSSHITILIEQLLQNSQVTLKELTAVAISGGPGSYTGLRIGSATAKGLCFSLDIPLIEVSTLQALAAQVIKYSHNPEAYLFCPMIDARRMEVYAYICDNELQALSPVAPVILEADTYAEFLGTHKIIFAGSGANKFQELLTVNTNAMFVKDIKPNASIIGELALTKLRNKEFEDVAYYEPFYLKEVYTTVSTKVKI